jgi:hypothetical protein
MAYLAGINRFQLWFTSLKEATYKDNSVCFSIPCVDILDQKGLHQKWQQKINPTDQFKV